MRLRSVRVQAARSAKVLQWSAAGLAKSVLTGRTRAKLVQRAISTDHSDHNKPQFEPFDARAAALQLRLLSSELSQSWAKRAASPGRS